ncbi:MFS transporter [Candidatus Halobonum tyrrellensis]|uniref:Major facilitator superfamily protein n=1 Tax=Candidatus Halobonum tyrrellensis G22 TaxID=1324957 RepID=V4HP24_9EURY|nr:MFS transporter [Candidatus Halobonum tyrrellensis]ESP89669.1 major facilitator superfamily protein [Candidatus Halobonum tyrrellensis G22]
MSDAGSEGGGDASGSRERARRARVADSAVFAIVGTAFATWAVRIPAVEESLGLSSGDIGVALVGLAVGSVVGLLTSGALVSRYGGRTVIRAGLVLYCLVLPVVALAGGLVGLVAALVAFGFGKGLVDVAANAQGVRVESAYPGQIMGSFHALFSAGGLLGSGLGAAAVALGLSVGAHFALVGAALLACGLAASRWLLPRDGTADAGPAVALPSRELAGFCVIGFCALFIEGVGSDWSAVFLETAAGASPTVAALGFAAFSLTMMLGRFLADRVVRVTGATRFLRWAALLAAAGLAVTLVAEPLVSLVGFAVLGLGLAGVVPVAWTTAANHDPGTPAETAIAAVATAGYGGFVVGPVVIGAVASAATLRVALVPAVGLAALVALCTAALPADATTGSGERDAAGAD